MKETSLLCFLQNISDNIEFKENEKARFSFFRQKITTFAPLLNLRYKFS